ncbi:Alpha/Beta hydrolase protein [Kickxella alabastrina]|uniref:Alpha/Beta hydrolase protein n=1 Tax=Kickxella alabastrina TaxID=61397 RepID=UPI00221E4558|nr:Alpha/Beta hydrolase protein [Kickxella alabastrina]KAI7834778.1 Alpha/Beta hydrolase protein [Kickxella alabastrina]
MLLKGLVRACAFALCTLTATLVQAQDLDFTPGKTYSGKENAPYLNVMKKYMSLCEASYYFLRQGGGFTCGAACKEPVFHKLALNTTWHSPNPVSDGYIAINTKDKEIYVVWTGTRRLRAIVADAVVIFEGFPPEIHNSGVHYGFYQVTYAVLPHIVKNIRAAAEDFPDYNIVFLGHSLGGANAVLSALMFVRENSYYRDRIRVWTFGEPRVGNHAFSEYYTSVLGNQTFRITNQGDFVPHVPPWQILGYQHHPLEIHIINKDYDFYVCQKTVREDLDGAYRWPTIDTGFSDHVDYFGKPDIGRFDAYFEF